MFVVIQEWVRAGTSPIPRALYQDGFCGTSHRFGRRWPITGGDLDYKSMIEFKRRIRL